MTHFEWVIYFSRRTSIASRLFLIISFCRLMISDPWQRLLPDFADAGPVLKWNFVRSKNSQNSILKQKRVASSPAEPLFRHCSRQRNRPAAALQRRARICRLRWRPVVTVDFQQSKEIRPECRHPRFKVSIIFERSEAKSAKQSFASKSYEFIFMTRSFASRFFLRYAQPFLAKNKRTINWPLYP